jgi:hypothetical protein
MCLRGAASASDEVECRRRRRGPQVRQYRGRAVESIARSPITALLRPSGQPRSHARVGMTLPPTASLGTGLISREARDVLSYRYATSPESLPYRILHDQSGCPAGLLALWRRADPSHPIPLRMSSAPTAPDGDSQRFRWSAWVWSPPPESNRRPLPYHGIRRPRATDRGPLLLVTDHEEPAGRGCCERCGAPRSSTDSLL